MNAKKRDKYLRSRAITSPWRLEGCPLKTLRAAIVIPALAESTNLPATLESLAQNPVELLAQTLVILVVNQREATSAAEKMDNQQTLDWLSSQPFARLNLCWVDASSPGLEFAAKEGVGLARRVGFDLALERLDWFLDPLFISLDADTLVEPGYLAAIFAHFRTSPCSGAYLPFRHQAGATAEQEAAIRLYELYLRSYLFGLQWAASPYAFTALGSAIACRAQAYVAAGGMRRRQAGEDFYFLQQLVKCGGVAALQGTVVRPSPRFSQRVPFGTGRTLQAAVEGHELLYQFVDHKAFLLMKNWLMLIEERVAESGDELLQRAGDLSPHLRAFLDEFSFADNWQRLKQNHAPHQLLKAWDNWFDGLRTRQLLQRLSANRAQPEPSRLVAELLAAAGYPHIEEVAEQLRLLEGLQGVAGSGEGSLE